MIPISLVNNQRFSGSGGQSKDSNNIRLPEEQLYQILIVEDIDESDATSPNLGLKTRVFTGTQEELKTDIKTSYEVDYLGELYEQIQELPNEGLDMESVMPFPNTDSQDVRSLFINQYPTVRRLLQGRKLSQLIASTWLKGEQENSIIPKGCKKYVKKLLLRGNRGPDEDNAHEFASDNYTDQMIITSDQANWQNINLNLLFCGQAYLFKNKKNIFKRLCEPLLSTYEASQLYAFEVVWHNFAAILEERSQSGIANPRGPYYKVLLPYPPCPNLKNSELGLKKKMIEKWVTAKDVGAEAELPFVNEEWDADKGINIQFVIPPYPYLPLSSCC